ncbi:uncharacterized protein LOC107481221 [Arachis duranensis]|uniref:Uncharacterized protein LOC107481221 n=1 Tax=Arachis duranensis TaxID=130453 RepID=A0A6P4CT78_ARADU|nr:uncharacterized protein LOC107481221 [Arachis duranensis]XP_016190931.1 uncharacterized protein LOC107631874 [Arachis ipaensis]
MTNNRRCGLLKLVSLRNASHSSSNAKPDSHLAATLTAKKSVSGFHTNIDDAVAFFIRLMNEHRTSSQLELGLVEATALPYLGIRPEVLSMDEKAELLFLDQGITTAVVLGIIYAIASNFQPLPQDFFKYDLRDPFSLQKGWLLWAGIGLVGAIASIALTGVAVSFFNGEPPQRETDALVKLLPLIGSSNVSTACLVGITGVLAPVLEETLFRGFLMASMTKWVPTPVAIIISAAVFALAHLTPGEFPQLFVLGAALGISYAQTRNLLTPITIHAFWNSGVILLLTFLLLQGYDIKELLQTS